MTHNPMPPVDPARFIPGYRSFSTDQLVLLLKKMAATDKCRGVVLVVDTLKKAVDLMSKREGADFGEAVRACVQKGLTFVGLAHTRKNLSATGKFVPGGTSDMIEDADAAALLTTLENSSPTGEKVIVFDFVKRRGGNVNEAYAYAASEKASYDELLASVHLVDPDKLDRMVADAEAQTDERLIDAVLQVIGEGVYTKMLLADAVAKRAGVSKRRAIQVIERYQGDDPTVHRWSYSIQARGAKVYQVLTA